MGVLSGLAEFERNRQIRARRETTLCMREHRSFWMITQYKCNHSAFNGYHKTPSDYSEIVCTHPECRRRWRTTASYVEQIRAGRSPYQPSIRNSLR